jgi:hypothetical protein
VIIILIHFCFREFDGSQLGDVNIRRSPTTDESNKFLVMAEYNKSLHNELTRLQKLNEEMQKKLGLDKKKSNNFKPTPTFKPSTRPQPAPSSKFTLQASAARVSPDTSTKENIQEPQFSMSPSAKLQDSEVQYPSTLKNSLSINPLDMLSVNNNLSPKDKRFGS